jgi:hypothetical protein
MKNIILKIAAGACLLLSASANAASTITVTVGGTPYTIGYFNTPYGAAIPLLESQPWHVSKNPDVAFINNLVLAVDAADPTQSWASGGIAIAAHLPKAVYFLYGAAANPMTNVAWGAGATPGTHNFGRISIGAPQVLNGGLNASYAVLIPEPAAAGLCLAGMGVLVLRRRRTA